MKNYFFTAGVFVIEILFLNTITSAQEKQLTDEEKYPCKYDSAYQTLNFWVGNWNVYDLDGKLVGEDKVEKILNDCAIIENWKSSTGGEGKSLFYYNSTTKEWKQVWVTDKATQIGGQKEKKLIKQMRDGTLVFQGSYLYKNLNILDRTSLTPLKGGRVKQVIEWSKDNGANWNKNFEAYYIKKN